MGEWKYALQFKNQNQPKQGSAGVTVKSTQYVSYILQNTLSLVSSVKSEWDLNRFV